MPFPSPGDLPDPGIEPSLLHFRQILCCLSYNELTVSVVQYRSLTLKNMDAGFSLHDKCLLKMFKGAMLQRLAVSSQGHRQQCAWAQLSLWPPPTSSAQIGWGRHPMRCILASTLGKVKRKPFSTLAFILISWKNLRSSLNFLSVHKVLTSQN